VIAQAHTSDWLYLDPRFSQDPIEGFLFQSPITLLFINRIWHNLSPTFLFVLSISQKFLIEIEASLIFLSTVASV
jgi:hypothetical protein